MSVGLIGDIWRWLERWLVEHIGEHFSKEALVWLLTRHYVMAGLDFEIWVWILIALVVGVLIAWLVGASNDPPRQRALGGQHIWAGVVWLLIIVLALYVLW
jgi:hypothetical protein